MTWSDCKGFFRGMRTNEILRCWPCLCLALAKSGQFDRDGEIFISYDDIKRSINLAYLSPEESCPSPGGRDDKWINSQGNAIHSDGRSQREGLIATGIASLWAWEVCVFGFIPKVGFLIAHRNDINYDSMESGVHSNIRRTRLSNWITSWNDDVELNLMARDPNHQILGKQLE